MLSLPSCAVSKQRKVDQRSIVEAGSGKGQGMEREGMRVHPLPVSMAALEAVSVITSFAAGYSKRLERNMVFDCTVSVFS